MNTNENDKPNWLPAAVRPSGGGAAALLPIMAAVFIAFLVIGIAIPVLPLHVHQGLGLGTFLVGLVVGSQFAAAILSRVWAGRHSDTKGAKHAVVVGLMIGSAAGLLYVLSLAFVTDVRSVAPALDKYTQEACLPMYGSPGL